jgi:hypothetical protein
VTDALSEQPKKGRYPDGQRSAGCLIREATDCQAIAAFTLEDPDSDAIDSANVRRGSRC